VAVALTTSEIQDRNPALTMDQILVEQVCLTCRYFSWNVSDIGQQLAARCGMLTTAQFFGRYRH